MYKMVTLDNVQRSYEKMALEGLVEGQSFQQIQYS